jgi:hypothetical protein
MLPAALIRALGCYLQRGIMHKYGTLKYIALFDILGFKATVEDNLLVHVVREFEGLLTSADFYLDRIIRGYGWRGSSLVSYTVFSDTIIVSTHDISLRAFYTLVKFCQILMGRSFYSCLPLRGAITKGNVFIRDKITVGMPIIRAYQMEQAQDWVGCWVDEECVTSTEAEIEAAAASENIGWKRALLKYNIPLKSGATNQHWALNWIPFLNTHNDDLDGEINRSFMTHYRQTEVSEEIKRKVANTKKFIEYAYPIVYPDKRITLKY